MARVAVKRAANRVKQISVVTKYAIDLDLQEWLNVQAIAYDY